MDEHALMRRAIELSREGLRGGRGAYCAALVVRDGEVIGSGLNTVEQDSDPTAHCEVNAIREAAARLRTWDLSGCDLYTTWEPCPLCVSAIWCARIDRVFYANLLSDATGFGIDVESMTREVRADPGERSRPYRRLLGEEALAVVRDWWEHARLEGR